MSKKELAKWWLRALSIAVISIVGIVFLTTAIFASQKMGYYEQRSAVDGYLSLKDTTVYGEPVYLNGLWDSFEGSVCETEKSVSELGDASSQVHLPIGTITQGSKSATYRLKFSLPKGETTGLNIYIPNFYKSGTIYLNGEKQEYLKDGQIWLKYSTMESIVPLVNIKPEKEWQELVITGDFKNKPITLYNRPVTIGTLKNVSELAMFSSSNEMFLLGLVLLILVNGYVFMLFRPEHKIISIMTLFDTMILMRSALAMTSVASFAKDIFPWLPISDRLTACATMFFLMVGGIVGCLLSKELYDPQGKAPKWLIAPLPWIYAAFAVVFTFSPEIFELYGKYLLIAVYAITFAGVFIQYKISRSIIERRTYNLLQFIKTTYIGALIFIDIFLWGSGTNPLMLFYLYSVFFILHVTVRLYDNNESYRDVEKLNAGLEDTVLKRTQELSRANQILAELSVKDPLTQLFNRLHFEESLERFITEFNNGTTLHLCMFDLDFFKNINDTYGHTAGDEQLKSIAVLVASVVNEKAVFARFGGEEFVLLFTGSTRQEVIDCVKAVHMSISQDAAKNKTHTTASFGISSFIHGDSKKELINRADTALYEAKRLGRNCIATNFDNELKLL